MIVRSTAFEYNGEIPSKYTCAGADINPPLHLENIPAHAKTLALIVDDPDAPKGTFDHWVIWNIPPKKDKSENSKPGTEGKNGTGENGYKGPCPPSGTHRYFFKIYALDSRLELMEGAGKEALEEAMEGHVLAKAELVGWCKSKKQ